MYHFVARDRDVRDDRAILGKLDEQSRSYKYALDGGGLHTPRSSIPSISPE
jgi:hypothetical protein